MTGGRQFLHNLALEKKNKFIPKIKFEQPQLGPNPTKFDSDRWLLMKSIFPKLQTQFFQKRRSLDCHKSKNHFQL